MKKMKSLSCFKPRDPFRNWSKELDKRVAIWAENFNSSFKLLLLGPAGAGKTTILKQMKIIHFEGFSLEERQQKAREIRSNLIESVRELTTCITSSGHQINWSDKENQARLDFINGLENLDDQTYDLYAAKIYDYSKRILTDKGVEELFAQLNQLSITHRSQYLLNRVDEIRSVNYIPNNDDILQSRRRTCDIQKLEFEVNLPMKSASGSNIRQTFCMFDVGGQRGERRKWIQVFDGVSAVMFLIDSSSFDAIDDENGRNKLRETINLFHEVWTTRFLLNSNFVLLFNKQDILRKKIERGHRIEDHFPEYKNYKCQPQDKSFLSSASGKLSLFRSSSRSSRTSTSAAHPSSSCPSPRQAPKQHSAGGSLREKSYQGPPQLAQMRGLASAGNTPASLGRRVASSPSSPIGRRQDDQQQQQQAVNKTLGSTATRQRDPIDPPGKETEQSRQTRTAASSPPPSKEDLQAEYIRARSFIRDKFLQVTRQADLEQRKMSSPNMMYTSKGCVDQPKRNVCYHYTTATDTDNIRDLFENLQRMVIKSTMKDLR